MGKGSDKKKRTRRKRTEIEADKKKKSREIDQMAGVMSRFAGSDTHAPERHRARLAAAAEDEDDGHDISVFDPDPNSFFATKSCDSAFRLGSPDFHFARQRG